MNSFVAFTLFACISAASVTAEDNEKILQIFNKCSEMHKISDDELAMIQSKQSVPSSAEAKCMAACMLKEGKLIIGTTYMKDNALMIADALYKDSADMASKAREVVEHCATEVGVDTAGDDCEFAYKLAVCSDNHAKKIGVTRPF
uniref:Uncharacterized protein n=2 Tax=Rhodnius prolixus TaxID=13249 RepID=T1HD09_RHOPR